MLLHKMPQQERLSLAYKSNSAGSLAAKHEHIPLKIQEKTEPRSTCYFISAHEVKATGLLIRCQKKLQLPRAIEDKGALLVKPAATARLSNASLVSELRRLWNESSVGTRVVGLWGTSPWDRKQCSLNKFAVWPHLWVRSRKCFCPIPEAGISSGAAPAASKHHIACQLLPLSCLGRAAVAACFGCCGGMKAVDKGFLFVGCFLF